MQDLDKVLDAAAGCEDLEMTMQGLQVASKLIACNSGWLEQQRDGTWAALWRALATADRRHFHPQHVPSAMQGGSGAGWIEYVPFCLPTHDPLFHAHSFSSKLQL
jgi:hypothetical protein